MQLPEQMMEHLRATETQDAKDRDELDGRR
jgi:hypothetical protein